MRRHRHLAFYWSPVFIYCFFIFLQSSFPASESIPDLRFMDKLLHFLAYALLSAMILRALRRHYETSRFVLAMVLSIGLSALYGISDEFHQSFVPSRSADMADVLADLLGSLFGVFVYRYILNRYFSSYPYHSGLDKIANYI